MIYDDKFGVHLNATEHQHQEAMSIPGDDDSFQYNLWREAIFMDHSHHCAMVYANTGYFDDCDCFGFTAV